MMIKNVVFLESLTPQLTQYCTEKIKAELEGKVCTFSKEDCYSPEELEETPEYRRGDYEAYQAITNVNVLAILPLHQEDFISKEEIDSLNFHLSDDFTKFTIVCVGVECNLEKGRVGEKSETEYYIAPYIMVLFKEDIDEQWFLYCLEGIPDPPKIEGHPVCLNDDNIIEKLNRILG